MHTAGEESAYEEGRYDGKLECNKEIERLKKAFIEIRNLAIATPDDNNIDRLNEAINDMMAIAKQVLKEKK